MSTVFTVILAGGSGTRFWPASRKKLPKQLLALGPGEQVLLAATVERLSPLCPPSQTIISTGRHVLERTQAVLPQLPKEAFLGEPLAKNTAPCIGWAVESIARRDPEAVVIVVPSDQYIADVPGYQAALKRAVAAAQPGVICTLGITPTRPETGYGYIEAGKDEVSPGARKVLRFVEKPDLETAESYLAAGAYFWNAGMFIFRAQTMLDEMQRNMPELFALLMNVRAEAVRGPEAENAAVEELFEKTKSVSIDYGVMEKAKELLVIPADVGWSDLGSFQVAWELAPKDSEDNVAPKSSILIDAKGNLIMDLRTQPDLRKTAVVGVTDLCVIQTDDALLVIPRERCQDVRAVVAELKQQGLTELI